MNFLSSFAGLFIINSVFAGMELIPQEKVEICTKPDEEANVTDSSTLQVIVESDDDFFLNGSVKFLKAVKAPWKVYNFAEQFYRDQWVPGFEKKIEDFCGTIRSPLSVTYQFFKGQKGCPLEAGDEWTWNMFRIPVGLVAFMPPHFTGKWRDTFFSYFNFNGTIKNDCCRFHFDLIHTAYGG